MNHLQYTNYKNNPHLLAKRFNISIESAEIYLSSEIIDPHTVSYVWTRVFGYDMTKRHKPKPFGIPFLNQVDFPRCREANMSGIVWDITTNPFLRDKNKLQVIKKNIQMVLSDINKCSHEFKFVSSYTDYQESLKDNKTASWLSIQGGQAIDNNLDNLDKIPEIHRITLIHFTKSKIGVSSFDRKNREIGLSNFGKEFVEKMVENKIIVDLSHINKKGFFDALNIVKKDTPVVVTHTGIDSVFSSWRNIDDQQIKAIANTGGTVGIIYYPKYLAKTLFSCSTDKIVDHIEHVIKIAGEDFVTLGSDYDGMISLPKDMKDITYQPLLVEEMLKRKWTPERIKKILGLNFLRVIKNIRP
ncbi:MAG: membrane dipeptidase [Candidatus Sericytochromatia bacterium]|nr:membrane dipeptidase [Candidatus Sericytochromatia bacterium]